MSLHGLLVCHYSKNTLVGTTQSPALPSFEVDDGMEMDLNCGNDDMPDSGSCSESSIGIIMHAWMVHVHNN